MQVENLTFDQLPKAVNTLIQEVSELKKMLTTIDERQLNQEDQPEFITIKEACEILKVSEVTLWRYQKEGKVKVYGIGSRRLLKRDEVLNSLTLKK